MEARRDAGGDSAANARAIESILRGEPHPARSAVAINAAAAVVVARGGEPKDAAARSRTCSSRVGRSPRSNVGAPQRRERARLMGLLDDILARKSAEVAELSARAAEGTARARRRPRATCLRAAKGRMGAPLRLIAEIKFRSPSAGVLSRSSVRGNARAPTRSAGADDERPHRSHMVRRLVRRPGSSRARRGRNTRSVQGLRDRPRPRSIARGRQVPTPCSSSSAACARAAFCRASWKGRVHGASSRSSRSSTSPSSS